MIRLRTINKWFRRFGLVLVIHELGPNDPGHEDGAIRFSFRLERNNPCIPVAERRWFSW